VANSLKQSQLRRAGRNEEGDYAGYAMRFRLVGEWKRTMDVIQRLPNSMKESSLNAQMKLGEEVIKRVKAHLRKQDLPWPPLHSDTQAKKSRADLDPRALIAYGSYYHNIKVWRVGSQKTVLIGVKPGIYTRTYMGKRSKIDIARIAAIHEFSSGKRVPKRPLWNPTIREMGGAQGFKDQFLKSFKAYLRRAGIPFKHLKL